MSGYELDPGARFNFYLAGALSDMEEPRNVRDRVKGSCPLDVNWLEPMDVEPNAENLWETMRFDLEAVEMADGVFVYRQKGIESWGTLFEIFHAIQSNTPVVVWNLSDEGHNQWMELPLVVRQEPEAALDALAVLARLQG